MFSLKQAIEEACVDILVTGIRLILSRKITHTHAHNCLFNINLIFIHTYKRCRVYIMLHILFL